MYTDKLSLILKKTKTQKTQVLGALLIVLISLISSLVIVLYYKINPSASLETHVPHGTFEILERNYDGPSYVAIAQTFYNSNLLEKLSFNNLPPVYFATHFPVYPILIKVFAPLFGNYFTSALAVSWISSILLTVILFKYFVSKKISRPLVLAVVSLFIPARWLAVRSVGSSEPIFEVFLVLTFIFWEKKSVFWSSIFVALTIITRPSGVPLYFGLLALLFIEKIPIKKLWPLLIPPTALVALLTFFSLNFGDLLAYFHSGTGTNAYLKFVPFTALLGYNSSVSEGFIYLYGLFALGIFFIWKQGEKRMAVFCLIYFLTTLFILSDDIYRYLLPISPFVIIFAFRKFLTSKFFLVVLFIPYLIATYIYTVDLLPRRLFHYGDYVRLRMENYSIDRNFSEK